MRRAEAEADAEASDAARMHRAPTEGGRAENPELAGDVDVSMDVESDRAIEHALAGAGFVRRGRHGYAHSG